MNPDGSAAMDDGEYERLLAFRDGLRRFVRWSDEQAKAVGLTGAHYQLLLAIRGHRGVPSISDVADHLLLRHHSAVELIDRADAAGLVRRIVDDVDQRVVRLALTPAGEGRLADLAAVHIEELARLRPDVEQLWSRLPESP